tara:strand:+ start:5 stop:1675 length:1671 start_codon:yes stop_codon:yes gene_type:complete
MFPWPDGMALSKQEMNIVWIDACASNSFFGRVNESLTGEETLKGARPNGRGGWFYSGKLPPLYEMVFTDFNKDPNLQFSKSVITKQLIDEISTNLAPLCIDYWNEHERWFIRQVFSTLSSVRLKDSANNPVDISDLLDKTAKEIFELNGDFSTEGTNPFSPNVSPFVPASFEVSRMSIGLTDQIPHNLIDSIRGRCILNEMMDFDYEALLWKPLQVACPCTDESRDSNRDFYSPFIYSDELYRAIEEIALPWLVLQPDWNTPLRDLIAPQWESPEKTDKSILSSRFLPDGEVQQLEHKIRKDQLLTINARSYCCGDNPFYDPDEVGENDEAESFEFTFDCESYKKDLLSDKEFVDDYGEDGVLSQSLLDNFAANAKEEAKEEAREEYDEKKSSAPFVDPFIIESLNIKQVDSQKRQVLEIVGDQFLDLWSLSSLGDHWTLLDEMSADFSTLSSFIKENNDFFTSFGGDGGKSLLYITDFMLTTSTSFSDMAFAVATYFIKLGQLNNICIVFHPKALERRYPAGPYYSMRELSLEYEHAKSELVESFKTHGLACAYI